MFHHFHDNGIHTKGQGSIDQEDFIKMIKFIGRKNIVDADVFFEKFKENKLKNNEVCLTFDDAIKCQIDIALPILEELKISLLKETMQITLSKVIMVIILFLVDQVMTCCWVMVEMTS